MTDRIVYIEMRNAGGVDGMDHTDKGGKILRASFKDTLTPNPWTRIARVVVGVEAQRKNALSKLNPVDKLILGICEEP